MAAIGYHCSAKVISRGKGQSAVASVAYRTGTRLKDELYGKTQDYSRKDGVEFVWHVAPEGAPEWARDVESAWNAVEARENRKNSTLAREYVAAFPAELSAEQREWMLKDFVREEITRKGLLATAVIHAPSAEGDERNYHTHIMFAERPLDQDGWGKHKDRSVSSYEERKETLDHAREKWAELGARQLERAGHPVAAARWRHGHERLGVQRERAIERGDLEYAAACDGEPTKHLGYVATEIERDGRESHRGRENREIEERNAERADLAQELAAIEHEIRRVEREPDEAKTPDEGQEVVAEWLVRTESEPEQSNGIGLEDVAEGLVEGLGKGVETAAGMTSSVGLGLLGIIGKILDVGMKDPTPDIAMAQQPKEPSDSEKLHQKKIQDRSAADARQVGPSAPYDGRTDADVEAAVRREMEAIERRRQERERGGGGRER